MTKRMYVRIVATLVILLVAVSLYSSTNTMTRYHPNPMTKADASNRTMITTIHNNDNSDNDDSNNNTTTTTVATNINTMTTIHNKYKLINVGLVSSGTSSFARVTTKLLGLRSAHTLTPWTRHALQQEGWGVLSETNLTLTTSPSRSSSSSRRRRRNTTLLVTELEQYDAFGDIPFMAPYIIAQAGQSVRQHAIVAGSRSSRSRRSGVGNRNETTATTTSSMTRTTFIFIATNRTKASWVTSMLKRPNKGGVAFRVFYELPTCTEDKEDNEDDQNPRVVNHGGCMMKTLEPITADQWGTVYDGHQQLLREYGIPTLDLEATTARK